jgi:Transposase IS116/IS110/IS902 family
MMQTTELEPLKRLSRDLRNASKTLTTSEARYLVDAYYQLQDDRIRADGQIRSMQETAEPSEVLRWLSENTGVLERNIKSALAAYSQASELGRWAESITGIGPIISAGLLAHIDIYKAPTVGHIWRYAGLDPTSVWGKGQKRPWNASLKVLCWKIGESFVKVSGNDKDIYGKIYLERKALEISKNTEKAFADQAAAKLEKVKIGKETDAYKAYIQGYLPPGHLHARAKRYAVKLFLAHWHHVAYSLAHQQPPPKPYVITQLGHAHEIPVPNWP